MDKPVSIRALKGFVCEMYGPEAPKPLATDTLSIAAEPGNKVLWHTPILAEGRKQVGEGKKVAVIGAGLCLGALASVICDGRTRALGITLAMWFVFVLFYDLVALGIALLVNPHLPRTVILISLFGNPVDLARIAGLLILGGETIFGAAGATRSERLRLCGQRCDILCFLPFRTS